MNTLARILSSRFAQFALYTVAFMATLGTAKALFSLMGAEKYAEYVVLFSISMVVRILWYNTGISAFARFYPSGSDGDGRSYTTVVLVFLAVPVVILLPTVAAILWFQIDIRIGELQMGPSALAAGILLGIALGTNGIVTELDNVSFNRLRASLAMTMPGLAALAAALIAGTMGLPIVAMVFLAATVILVLDGWHLLLFLRFARRTMPQTLGSDWLAIRHLGVQIGAFAAPLVVWTGPAILMRVADKWLATAMLDLESVALFGVITMLSQNAFAAIYSVLNRAYIPDIYQQAADRAAQGTARAHRQVNNIARFLALAGMCAFVAAVFTGGPILALISEPRFSDHGWLLALMMVGAATYTIGDCYLLHGHIGKTLKPYIPVKLLVPFIYIGLAAILTGVLGVQGLVLAYSVSALLYVAMAHLATARMMRSRPFETQAVPASLS